ncbi:MAG TPA: CBS domain-containing protein [Thermoanaerobaculia bacterium]|jgi:acetoin utilization protein AcuB|nr:CBS domain-containing protein [Thermoanaerobaculia bacterium]
MRVQDVMTRRVETIDGQENAQVAFDSMKFKGIRHLVVKRDSELVGVLSQRDLGVPDEYDFREKHRVAELMSKHVVTASPEMSVKQAANLMRGRTIGCLPVVEEGHPRRLVGIVTVSDLLELLGRGIDRPTPGKRATLKTRAPRVDAKAKRMR